MVIFYINLGWRKENALKTIKTKNYWWVKEIDITAKPKKRQKTN